jgi:hypothetical protein
MPQVTPLTWDSAPEGLTAAHVAALISARPVWVRRHLRHLAKLIGPRSMRWSKESLRQWWESQGEQQGPVIG